MSIQVFCCKWILWYVLILAAIKGEC